MASDQFSWQHFDGNGYIVSRLVRNDGLILAKIAYFDDAAYQVFPTARSWTTKEAAMVDAEEFAQQSLSEVAA